MSALFHHRLALAKELFKSGHAHEAEKAVKEALEINPHSADALHLRGVICGSQGLYQSSELHLKRAADLDPNNHYINYNLAKALSEQGKDRESIRWHRRALERSDTNPLAWLNYGVSLLKLKDYQAAIRTFDRALFVEPKLAEAYCNKGTCFRETGRLKDSLDLYYRAVEIKPDYAEAWSNCGLVLRELGQYQDALACFEQAIRIKNDFQPAWVGRGMTLRELNSLTDSLESFNHAINLKPDSPEAWLNRGILLCLLGHHHDAIIDCKRAIDLNPVCPEAWTGYGFVLNDLERYGEALKSFENSIEIAPDSSNTWLNHGVALFGLGRHSEAIVSYRRAIKLDPNNLDAIYNLGLLQLSQKNFLEGYESYLARWGVPTFPSKVIEVPLPRVNSGSDNRRGILLWREQGLGDEIFFSGMLKLAEERFPNLGLIVDDRLLKTFSRSFPFLSLFSAGQVAVDEVSGRFSSQAPIGDLGHILGLDEDQIRATRRPFLVSDKDLRNSLRSTLSNSDRLVCGVSWKSSRERIGGAKSINLADLSPVLTLPHLDFLSLQYGDVDVEVRQVRDQIGVEVHQVKDIDAYNDIDGLLALVDACDIVLTTSNVTAHLAGSIGKKGCVLVPFAKGRLWYWHMDDPSSFWYPTLKVVYQKNCLDWSGAITAARDLFLKGF